jgi:hypothetical protein
VRKALETAGIQVIDNRSLPLASADGRLWLAGIGDDMTGHARPDAAFAGVPADARLIVIMHDPANAAALPPQTVVAFAGHTHGGQVRLPLIGALITPGRAPRRHSWGWIPDAPAPTWVTAGIGTSILPIRFNCPPPSSCVSAASKTDAGLGISRRCPNGGNADLDLWPRLQQQIDVALPPEIGTGCRTEKPRTAV